MTQKYLTMFTRAVYPKRIILAIAMLTICALLQTASAQFSVNLIRTTAATASGTVDPFRQEYVGGKTYIMCTVEGNGLTTTNGTTFGGGYSDVSITSFDASGNVAFSSYIGGNDAEEPLGFKVANGKIYVLYRTRSTNLPVTNGSGYEGGGSFFNLGLSVYNDANGALEMCTYISGNSEFYLNFTDLFDVDGTDIIVAGMTTSTNFITTDGSTASGFHDVFIRRYTATGNILYSRLMGSTQNDFIDDVLLLNGNFYISGTAAPSFPVTDGSIAPSAGSGNNFFTRINAATGATVFSRFTGFVDFGSNLVTDGVSIYMVGSASLITGAATNPITISGTMGGGFSDIIIARYNTSGSLLFSRYLGGGSADNFSSVIIDNGNLYIAGSTSSSDYPVLNGLSSAGGVTLTKLNSSGNILYSTYYPTNTSSSPSLEVVNGEAYLITNANSDVLTADGTTTGKMAIAKFTTTGTLCMSSLLRDNLLITAAGTTGTFKVVGNIIYMGGVVRPLQATTGGPVPRSPGNPGTMQYKICPALPAVVTDPVTPATQNVCSNGLVQQIKANDIVISGATDLPLLYVQGSPIPQSDISFHYQWQSGTSPTGPWTDIAGATEKNYSPSPTTISVYFRRLTRAGACCGGGATISTSDVASIIVNGNFSPVADAGGASLGILQTCPSSAVIIGGSPSASGGLAPYTYSWNNGAGSTANPSVSPAENSIYTLTVTDANGCQQADQVIVNTFSANAGPDKGNCSGASVQIGTPPPAGASGVTYSWAILSGTPGSLSSTTIAQPMATPSVKSTYRVTMTITKSGGGTCSTTDDVVVTPTAAPPANFAGTDQVLCRGSIATLGTPEAIAASYTPVAVSQSSVDTYTATIANLSDDDNTTGAQTNGAPPEWVMIDLGGTFNINQVQLQALSGLEFLTEAASVEVSLNGISWTPVIDEIFGVTDAALSTLRFSEVTARYVRVINYNDALALSEFRVRLAYSYVWAPGSYITTNLSEATFNSGNLNLPNPNKITYTLSASANGCTFYDSVEVAVIEARAGADGCGPRLIGLPDRTPSLNETYSWSIVAGPGTGSFLGATNEAVVPVSESVGGPVTYRLTTSYTLNGVSGSCTSDVTVNPCGCQVIFSVTANSGCPSFGLSDNTVKITAVPVGYDTALFTYRWYPSAGLSATNTRTVYLTDNIQRTYTCVITHILNPAYTCSGTVSVNNPAWSLPVVNAPSPVFGCANAPVIIGDPASNPGLTYSWTGVGLANPNISLTTATNTTESEYILTATDNVTGCKTRDTIIVQRADLANAGLDKTVCDNGIITLGTPAKAGYTYSWDPAGADWRNGTNQTFAQPDAFVAISTTFTLTQTHTASGCVSTDQSVVTVSPGIAPFVMSPLSYCPGGTALELGYSDGTTGGTNEVPADPGYTYLWSPDNIINDATIRNPTVLTPMPGTATTFTVKVVNAAGCNTTSTQTITPTISSVNAGPDKIICLGTSTAIGSASNPTGGGITYNWSPATGLSSATSPNPTFTPSVNGTFTFIVTKTEAGCTTTDEVSVTVQSVTLTAIAPVTICSGASVIIGPATLNPTLTYNWTPATGLSSTTIGNPIATLSSSQVYTLTATDNLGCQAKQTVMVGVNSTPAPTVSVPNVNACLNTTGVTFNPSVSPAGSYDYQWTPAFNLSSSTVANPVVGTSVSGTYTYNLTVTSQANGCYNTAYNVLAVINVCAPLSVNLSGNVFIDLTNDNTVNGTGTGSASAVTLFATLVAPTGNVVATMPVNPDGTYRFTNVTGNTVYSVVLSTLPGVTGNSAPMPLLPVGWSNRGENLGTGVGNDGSANGILTNISVGSLDVINANFGIVPPASLGNRVWRDDDIDGIQDSGEPGVAGITVTLKNNADIIIGTTVTDAYGNYLFSNLPAGTYNITVTLPANYTFTTQTNTTDDNNTSGPSTTGSDVNVTTGQSYSVVLDAGESNLNIDAGIIFSAPGILNSIGDKVWYDSNNDGDLDTGEPGIAGVTVTLYAADGVTLVAATVTNATGNYIFNNLPANTNYIVGFSPLPGTLVTGTANVLNVSNASTNCDANAVVGSATYGKTTTVNTGVAGNIITGVDAGLKDDPKASLGDFVWNDIDGDGLQDAGEPGVPGVTMRLYDAGPNSMPGGGDDIFVQTTTTDVNGYYLFSNLNEKFYFVTAVLPSGYNVTTKDAGNDYLDSDFDLNASYPGVQTSGSYHLLDGKSYMGVDMGIRNNTTGLGSIGDRVWMDTNMNGLQDGSEKGVAGIAVSLLDGNGNPVNNPATGRPYVLLTDSSGNYKFVDLPVGNYQISFSNLPANTSFTTANASGSGAPGSGTDGTDDSDVSTSKGKTATIALGAGQLISSVDAGIVPAVAAGKSNIGNKIWIDADNDGIQDSNEQGVPAVTVELYFDSNGDDTISGAEATTPFKTTITDGQGGYLFGGLDNGLYQVKFVSASFPSGYSLQAGKNNIGSDDALDSDADPSTGLTGIYLLAQGEDNLTVDAGVYNSTATNSIGDRAWIDINNDGKQDIGEPGIAGVTVSLLDNTGKVIASVTTDALGNYFFGNLPNGNYIVQITPPVGYTLTDQDGLAAGTTNANNSDFNTITLVTDVINLTGSTHRTDLDGGLVTTRAAIGDRVWYDANSDGIQDIGEPGITGVTVSLFRPGFGLDGVAGNADDALPVATTITKADGQYFFSNLVPGSYELAFSTVPAGLEFTQQNSAGDNGDNTNSDASPATGRTGSFALVTGETDLTADAGLRPRQLGGVGDFVWADNNNNGVQDTDEPAVPGMLATLRDNLDNVIGTTITDGKGNYLFVKIPEGTGYTIAFTSMPGGSNYTLQTVGTTNGSDAHPVTGVTPAFTVTAGQINRDIDAGIANYRVLPVHRLELTDVDLRGVMTTVKWLTDNEINTRLFYIERSTDSRTFSTVGSIPAGGNISGTSRYLFTDNIAGLNGIIYYRIQLVDIDGKITYSNIIAVRIASTQNVRVWPNPITSSSVMISLHNRTAGTVQILVTDAAGKLVIQTTRKISAGANQFTLNGFDTLARGVYFIRLLNEDGEKISVHKVEKQ